MYHHHKATHEFQRHISYVIDSSEQIVQYAVVQYLFDGGKEVPVVFLPHGNAKNTTTLYRQTQWNTLSRLKEVPGKPKDIVSLLYKEAGSVLEANSVSELPRDSIFRQVYNNQQSTSKGTGGVDPLFNWFNAILICNQEAESSYDQLHLKLVIAVFYQQIVSLRML